MSCGREGSILRKKKPLTSEKLNSVFIILKTLKVGIFLLISAKIVQKIDQLGKVKENDYFKCLYLRYSIKLIDSVYHYEKIKMLKILKKYENFDKY